MKLLSHQKTANLVKRCDFTCDGAKNIRQVHCKRCGTQIASGLGVKWRWSFEKTDRRGDEYFIHHPVYLCEICHAYWSGVYFGFDEVWEFLPNLPAGQIEKIRQYISMNELQQVYK